MVTWATVDSPRNPPISSGLADAGEADAPARAVVATASAIVAPTAPASRLVRGDSP